MSAKSRWLSFAAGVGIVLAYYLLFFLGVAFVRWEIPFDLLDEREGFGK